MCLKTLLVDYCATVLSKKVNNLPLKPADKFEDMAVQALLKISDGLYSVHELIGRIMVKKN